MELIIKIMSCIYALFFVFYIYYFYKYIRLIIKLKKINKEQVIDNEFKIKQKKLKRNALILWLTFLTLFLIFTTITYILVYAKK
ncbi:hypothetical protein [Spiroplasma floricola]|uniref:Uncharacterized protein n=1 Tax=Spiroplasma floricola 23-6 TaxID=1336749 RepID=A0A2K8SEX2_9MOLU|nr:hypothetical protein [Spiroplasma floricola]AUB32017.1 hypothetical protein SFLOR_v1c09690 [Spiroplasma floricola 23-6]